ncbi:MAG: efflux RND transporter permease subunit [Desulfobacteraceae bacterium]|nr:MAG: efflux RND transporter permease subunit [Desulfobacteraceae bacterium]
MVNDAIVLIDFVNVVRMEGEGVREAVIKSGKLRFRPVMLTTASTVGGLLPVAIKGGVCGGPWGIPSSSV